MKSDKVPNKKVICGYLGPVQTPQSVYNFDRAQKWLLKKRNDSDALKLDFGITELILPVDTSKCNLSFGEWQESSLAGCGNEW